jgi:radical SAM protein with 4Fe4S-binding SPASM domain
VERVTAGELAALWRRNRGRLAGDLQAGLAASSGRPAHLKIELTNYCNLACPMCPHPAMQRAVGHMRPELFSRIIDQAVPELEFAYLHHLGESLFHPHLGELIRYGKARGVALGLSTNATFLDERRARVVIESGLDFLVISLDAVSPDAYARMRPAARRPAPLDATVENVRRFFQIKRETASQLDAVVQLIATAANRGEEARFAASWSELGVPVMIKEPRDWAGQLERGTLGIRPKAVVHSPCKMPWTELTILWDGAVVPCANHVERVNVLGDLERQSLDEVWNGTALRALRTAHLRGALDDVPVCADCPRHPLDAGGFVAASQLELRRRVYLRAPGDVTPRPGLS